MASGHRGKTLRLSGTGERIILGSAKLSCSFQNPEINMRRAETAERIAQRVSEGAGRSARPRAISDLQRCTVLGRIKELFPSTVLLFSRQRTLLHIPDFPSLLIRLRLYFAEFRVIKDPESRSDTWYRDSVIWKKMPHEVLAAQDLDTFIRYAGHAVMARGEEEREDPS